EPGSGASTARRPSSRPRRAGPPVHPRSAPRPPRAPSPAPARKRPSTARQWPRGELPSKIKSKIYPNEPRRHAPATWPGLRGPPRQLVGRDPPRLGTGRRPVLGREPVFAILKGRRNYLCLHRERGGIAEDPQDSLFGPADAGPASPLGRQVKRLHEWAEETKTGDRDELVPGVPEAAWRQVSVSAQECIGAHRC